MTSGDMKNRRVKPTNKDLYPRVTFRLRAGQPERLRVLKEKCGLNPSWVLSQCLNNYLPVIEERHSIAASKDLAASSR